MKKLIILPALMLALTSFATEEKDAVGTVYTGNLSSETESADVVAQTHWDFITCTHDQHECMHEAQHHGYHHYYAVHDDHRCGGHAHYACYGGHH